MKTKFFVAPLLLCALTMVLTACPGPREDLENDLREAVDLGLSVKWASANIGANRPEKIGARFAWGETSPKSKYTIETYKFAQFTEDNEYYFTKYTNESTSAYPADHIKTLEPCDDAASVRWGNGWRMPTYDECDELYHECSWNWTTINGMGGYEVVGPNGNSIFLPVGKESNAMECYWSSTLSSAWDGNSCAYCLVIGQFWHSTNYYARKNDYFIRPVCK